MGDQLPNISSSSDNKAVMESSEVQLGSSSATTDTTEANSEVAIITDNNAAPIEIATDEENADSRPIREQWDSPIEFLMSCIAMSVGLGNIWRFPFTAYENGGGAFLIPYLIVLVFIARPIYFMELCLGQFSSCSQVEVWSCVPILKGIGIATSIATTAVLTYYCSINALTVYYFFASFQAKLPWTTCKGQCGNATKSEYTELYFRNEVLNAHDDISHGIGLPEWKLTLCLLFAWLTVLFTLIKGIKSSGKVSYFLALFPYLVLIVLLGVGCSLPGASTGIIYFIYPQWERLLDPKVWYNAVSQCFFSLNTGFGSIIMFSSYNKFNHKIYRDALIISGLDTFTSLLAGFTVFAVLGHLAHLSNSDIGNVLRGGGTSIAFISYPETISTLGLYSSQVMAVLFFLMLFSLGIGSSVSDAGAIIAVFSDRFPKFARWKITVIICVCSFLVGLIYVTPGGQAVLELVDYFGGSFIVFFTTTLEVMGIAWIYGLGNFARDIEFMLNRKIGWYWKLCWGCIIPIALSGIFIYSLIEYTSPVYGGYPFPTSAIVCGWLLALGSLSILPICAGLVIWEFPGTLLERFSASVRPSEDWGPKDPKKRTDWIAYKLDHPIPENLFTHYFKIVINFFRSPKKT